MVYALHRRQSFRSAGVATGWGFDLSKSEYLDFGTVLNTGVGETAGTPLAVGRLCINADSSSLICQPNSANGTCLHCYQFPVDHYGDISRLANAPYSKQSRTLFYRRRPFAFSPDGLHYIQQGHGTSNANITENGVVINNCDLLSCALDSSFDMDIPAFSTMSILKELTEEVVGLAFSDDGLYLFVLSINAIRSYYLQTPFDVSSASLTYSQVSLSRFNIVRVRNMQFSPDGSTLILHQALGDSVSGTSDSNNSVLHVFKLSVPFNITTLSLDHTWDIGTNLVYGFAIDHAGENIYISRSTTILQYSLSA